jgi:phosphatidylethanolamine/phosphatidyl-N-methylethanolamine N-methyltransferase
MMDYRMVKRAYAILSPVYDIIFDKVFHPGRVAAIDLLEIKPGDRVLEVGVGTGLNLPLYPRGCTIVGVDISKEMLRKARQRIDELGLGNVRLEVMDASRLAFEDQCFDHVIATYVISAVPDPVNTLREMRRVCRPRGHLVILNHFKSENPVIGALEEMLAPVCQRIGYRVNMLNGWRLVRCINPQ